VHRSTCPKIEVGVLADIMAFVPWAGFGPFESYDADETVEGGERLSLAGLDIDVIFTPGHSPRSCDLRRRGRGRAAQR
jgi:glyoxylase-like metal-dependent hydrolase (beta-lactamase superfamily II)